MLDLSSPLWISNCVGIELVLAPDGKATFNAVRISIDGKSLTFEKKAACLGSLEALQAAFPGSPYTALAISGKGVLHKKIAKVEKLDALPIGQVLPNANPDDFYVQNFISGGSSHVSLIRKSEADTWMARLTASGFKLLTLSFGPFPVDNVLAQLNVDRRDFTLGGYHVRRDENGHWLNWATGPGLRADFPIKIEAETLRQDLIVAYGSAFQLLYFDKLDTATAEVPTLKEAREGLSGNKKLQALGFALLGGFFLLLLVNFLALSYYSSAVEKLSRASRNTLEERSRVQGRLAEIKTHSALLDSVGYNGGLNEAVLIDQMAALLPYGMGWKSLAVSPLDEAKTRNEKKVVFSDRQIRLQGECGQVTAINAWIEGTRKLPWVASVLLENYALNPESGKGEFVIKVSY